MSEHNDHPDDQAPAPGPDVPQCGECLFYAPSDINAGECHARPPTTAPVPTPQGLGFATAWPRVTPDTWCGEFEPKRAGDAH